MTSSFVMGSAAALWLGILTSISPCPLTTNIAAISFVGKRIGSTPAVLVSGLIYTLGRALAYTAIAALIVAGAFSVPAISFFLQKNIHRIIGPFLLLTGLFLSGIIPIRFGVSFNTDRIQKYVEKNAILGAAFLGILFALAFCPVSAAIFFGSLIPLAIRHESRFLLPALYGIGTGLPVMLSALIIAFSVKSIGRFYNAVSKFEIWAARITAVVFIVAGAYLTFADIGSIL